jgi:hypothetical protein
VRRGTRCWLASDLVERKDGSSLTHAMFASRSSLLSASTLSLTGPMAWVASKPKERKNRIDSLDSMQKRDKTVLYPPKQIY